MARTVRLRTIDDQRLPRLLTNPKVAFRDVKQSQIAIGALMLDYALLTALAAVLNTGSFEKAAALLGVTPSAISQRIKLLEERIGTLLVIRGQPCEGTPVGTRLRRHVDEVVLLEQMVSADLGGMAPLHPTATIRVAVNADSLATWFPQAMAQKTDCAYDLVVDDEGHTLDWLRRGAVVAAVSAVPGPIQGCNTLPLGAMGYVACAAPAFIARWFPEGATPAALRQAPCIAFNVKDTAHLSWIERAGAGIAAPPTHHLSSPQAIVAATLAGLGWALNPAPLVATMLADGRLAALSATAQHSIPLYWHSSRLVAPALSSLDAAVTAAARQGLAEA